MLWEHFIFTKIVKQILQLSLLYDCGASKNRHISEVIWLTGILGENGTAWLYTARKDGLWMPLTVCDNV